MSKKNYIYSTISPFLYSSVIAKGASGGHGRLVRKSSHGAVITVLLKLEKGKSGGFCEL